MSSSSRALFALLVCGCAHAHVVSISNGEFRITGRTAAYELRMPSYEIEHTANPDKALLNEVRFGDASLVSSACENRDGWFTCRAQYEFPETVPGKLEVECTLYRATVPNHIHMLYAVQGENGDQRVFDQNSTVIEMRFHPPSFRESLVRDGGAGIRRLAGSVAGLLFLGVLALTAQNPREAGLLTLSFLAAEWFVRPVAPFIPLAMSPEFLEAVMALTVAYLAGELLLLPGGRARWLIVPLLGLIHGLPFAAFPPLYLGAASAVQAVLLAILSAAVLKIPAAWRKPAAGAFLLAAAGWFAHFVIR